MKLGRTMGSVVAGLAAVACGAEEPMDDAEEAVGERVTIFGRVYGSGWAPGGWSASSRVVSVTGIDTGRAVEATFKAPWAGFTFDYDWTAPDLAPDAFAALHFQIHPGSSVTAAKRNLVISTDNAGAAWRPLADFLPPGGLVANTWVEATVPISALNVGGAPYHRFAIMNNGTTSGFSVRLGKVWVERPEVAPPPPPPPPPPAPDPNRSAGCDAAPVAPNVPTGAAGRVTVAGVERTYWTYVPSTYDHHAAMPIVFVYHGIYSNGRDTSSWLRVQDAVRSEAVVVFLDARGGRWDLGGTSDLAFFDAARAQLEGQLCLDTSRRYALGFSAGAYFVNYLGCRRATWLAKIAVGDGKFTATCTTPNEVLVHQRRYDADETLTASGIPARDKWLTVNGCDRTVTEPAGLSPRECTRYPACTSGKTVVWCLDEYDFRVDFPDHPEWNHTIHTPYVESIWSYFRGR